MNNQAASFAALIKQQQKFSQQGTQLGYQGHQGQQYTYNNQMYQYQYQNGASLLNQPPPPPPPPQLLPHGGYIPPSSSRTQQFAASAHSTNANSNLAPQPNFYGQGYQGYQQGYGFSPYGYQYAPQLRAYQAPPTSQYAPTRSQNFTNHQTNNFDHKLYQRLNAPKNNHFGSSFIGPSAQQENALYFCEGCEKEFTTLSAYTGHCNTHETCPAAGCSFVGSKKVVNAHYESVHGTFAGTGYKLIKVEGKEFNVLLGTDPAEIAQWRAARRKNFPTPANVQLKLERQKALEVAGGVVEDERRGRKRKGQERQGEGESKKPRGSACDTGAGPEESSVAEKKRNCHYFAKGRCFSADKCKFNHDFKPEPCAAFLKGKCALGNKCWNLHDKETRKAESAKDKAAQALKAQFQLDEPSTEAEKPRPSKPAKKESSSKLVIPKPMEGGKLLRTLLQDEIALEDSLILQSIRYIVQSNYFENVK